MTFFNPEISAKRLELLKEAFPNLKRAAVLLNPNNPAIRPVAGAIGNLASKQRFPSIGFKEIAQAGGLMAYGVDFPEMYRRAAVPVDKILKGAKPGDLPVERSTRFHLVINLKIAKVLGLDLPPTLLARADEVIE